MATSTPNANNVVTKFHADYFREFVRQARFAFITGPLKGNSPFPIMVHQDRKTVSFPLITSLRSTGVSGTQTLDGNESVMSDYDFTVTPSYKREGIRLNQEEREKPAFDQMQAARPLLMDWSMEKNRDDTIEAFAQINNGTTQVNYSTATEAQKDTWLTNNSDRVLFGNAISNQSAGDHSTSLANIDSTNDKLDKGIIGIAKRMAANANPRIRPWKIKGKEGIREMYVMLVGQRAYRDFYNDATVSGDLQNARERAQTNPIFQPGDLMFDNVLIREIHEITSNLTDADNSTDPRYPTNGLSTAGNSSIAVEPCFLLGAQAVAFGLGQRPEMKTDNIKDYGFQPGVAVEMKDEIKKVFYNDVQHGMVTVYVSGVADS
jgi:hypothetical protein